MHNPLLCLTHNGLKNLWEAMDKDPTCNKIYTHAVQGFADAVSMILDCNK